MNNFTDTTKSTARILFFMVVSIFTLEIFQIVRFAYRYEISKLSVMSLNTYYNVLKTGTLNHGFWRDVTLSKDLWLAGHVYSHWFFLFMTSWWKRKVLRSKIFDNVADNGSNYLNVYCMVSILLSFLVFGGRFHTLSVVLFVCWLWDKKQTKLEFVAGMERHIMNHIGLDNQICLRGGRWYSEGCVAGFVDEYYNPNIICNARIHTVMYDFRQNEQGIDGAYRNIETNVSSKRFLRLNP